MILSVFVKNNKKTTNESGYTLVELLITIFIVSIILVAVSSMLVTMVKTSIRVDARRQLRQDMELSVEVFRRDVRNSVTAESFKDCDPGATYQLFSTSSQNATSVSLLLTNQQENVVYTVEKDKQNNIYSLVRTYGTGSNKAKVYLTSPEVDIKSFEIKCTKLLSENKFLLVTIIADSKSTDTDGPIVKDLTRYSGVTIRNLDR